MVSLAAAGVTPAALPYIRGTMIQSETEIIEVSHFPSEEEVARELEAKVRDLVETARGAESVAGATRVREAAEERRDKLQRASRELAGRAKTLFDENRKAAGRVDDALIEGLPVTAAQLDKHVRLEAEHRATLRASERVVERLLPLAEIEAMEQQAEEFFSHARELRRVADERMKVTARLLAEAAAHEGEIAFDPRNTVSGMLTAEADELERRGRDYMGWAGERRDKYAILARQL
jgi:hypothetical protein